MKRIFLVFSVLLFGFALNALSAPQKPPAAPPPADDYSGTYFFLQDGEFVQVTVEEEGKVTGFVSRFGDGESDRGLILDQFFKQGKLDGKKLSFTTQTVHATWYDFKGTVERGEGKKAGEEGYYILRGTLTQYTTDSKGNTTSKVRDVAFKSFPQDLGSTPDKKN